ncbi:MAG: response regulator [Mucilaginibacter sp.]|nr:response regulator [Mucilaginibacter sp.]
MIVEKYVVNTCIIDNNPVYVYGFKKIINLKGLSNHITHFSNGNEAIMHLKNPVNANNLPDVIFLDISMPVMDGWEFMKEYAEIKSQLGKKISIYMISSSIDASDIDRAKKIPDVIDYIFKPVDVNKLKEIFNSLRGISPAVS